MYRLVYHLGFGGFNKYHAEKPADLAGVYAFGIGILGNILPKRIVLQVVHRVRGAYANIVGPAPVHSEGASLGLFERAHGLPHLVYSQRIRCGYLASAGLAAHALHVVAA